MNMKKHASLGRPCTVFAMLATAALAWGGSSTMAQKSKARAEEKKDAPARTTSGRSEAGRSDDAKRTPTSHPRTRTGHPGVGSSHPRTSPRRSGHGSVRYGERQVVRHKDFVGRQTYPRRIVRHGREVEIRYRSYPRFGTRVRYVPPQHTTVIIEGRNYYRHDGLFYLQIGFGPTVEYVVTRPPIGVEVTYVPEEYQIVHVDGLEYIYADDVYYDVVLSDGQPIYRVVEPPYGASIVHLPSYHHEVILRGRRYYRVSNQYYEPYFSGTRVVYRRVRID